MSGKVRSFSVSAFAPTFHPFCITARSRHQLMHRLGEFLSVSPLSLKDVADVLWKSSPVFLTDVQLAILPGDFPSISYQMVSFGAPSI